MKLAIMQPYYFPYIGYWQLIHAADSFVLLDDVQYMRHGWINRNRILKPNGGWQYVIVPLERHAMTSAIREIRTNNSSDWRQRVLRQIDHYKKATRHFIQMRELIQTALYSTNDSRIAHVNLAIIRFLCRELGLERKILLSSEMGFEYRDVGDAGEWALRIAQQMRASQYINPVGGAGLFDPEKFIACGTEIAFLSVAPISYSQRREDFEPALSIIDVLMFNGLDGTRRLLEKYKIGVAPDE